MILINKFPINIYHEDRKFSILFLEETSWNVCDIMLRKDIKFLSASLFFALKSTETFLLGNIIFCELWRRSIKNVIEATGSML